ncbi:MAG: outer membrane protein assembly factor BamE [Gammaproteobacteria bacterium]|nr:outer membrane protein assembly factor BamE [Gammaproteobacteria bacterium]
MKKVSLFTLAALSLILSGCALGPHVPNVQQGNVIKQAMVNQIKPGMSKEQVKFLLGDPLLVDTFDNHYLTYIFTKQVDGGRIKRKRVTLQFNNNYQLVKIRQYPLKK